VKIFSGNVGVKKTCGETEFDIFEAKKASHSRKAYCVLKRKVAKMITPFELKMCEEFEFDIYKIPRIQEKKKFEKKT
jgi:hypothetical protein